MGDDDDARAQRQSFAAPAWQRRANVPYITTSAQDGGAYDDHPSADNNHAGSDHHDAGANYDDHDDHDDHDGHHYDHSVGDHVRGCVLAGELQT